MLLAFFSALVGNGSVSVSSEKTSLLPILIFERGLGRTVVVRMRDTNILRSEGAGTMAQCECFPLSESFHLISSAVVMLRPFVSRTSTMCRGAERCDGLIRASRPLPLLTVLYSQVLHVARRRYRRNSADYLAWCWLWPMAGVVWCGGPRNGQHCNLGTLDLGRDFCQMACEGGFC